MASAAAPAAAAGAARTPETVNTPATVRAVDNIVATVKAAATIVATVRAADNIVVTVRAAATLGATIKADAADKTDAVGNAAIVDSTVVRSVMAFRTETGHSATARRVVMARVRGGRGIRAGSLSPVADAIGARRGTADVRPGGAPTTSSGPGAAAPRAVTGMPVTTRTS